MADSTRTGDRLFRPELPPSTPTTLDALTRRCWAARATERPHFTEVHQILGQMNEAQPPLLTPRRNDDRPPPSSSPPPPPVCYPTADPT